jgi:hypothetical protein
MYVWLVSATARNIIFIAAGTLIAIAGSYLLFLYPAQLTFSHDNIPNNLKFDKESWQNGTIRQRGQMVNFLLDSIGIMGKTKQEIKTILGDPDGEIEVNDREYRSKLYYTVDKGHAFVYDMIISFDSTGHAKFILFDD